MLRSLVEVAEQHDCEQKLMQLHNPSYVARPAFGSLKQKLDPEKAIGVITPYTDQVTALKKEIRKEMKQHYDNQYQQHQQHRRQGGSSGGGGGGGGKCQFIL